MSGKLSLSVRSLLVAMLLCAAFVSTASAARRAPLSGPAPVAEEARCDDWSCVDIREILNPPPYAVAQAPVQAPVGRPPIVLAAARSGPPMSRPVPTPYRQFAQARRHAAPPAQPKHAEPAKPIAKSDAGAWSVQCPPNQTAGCEIMRRVVAANGQQLLAIIVGPNPRQPGTVQATLVLPLGVAVRESVPLLIDDHFIALMPIEVCVAAGCVMHLGMPPAMVGVLRNGKVLKLLALAPNGQTVPLAVSLEGFGAAFTKVTG